MDAARQAEVGGGARAAVVALQLLLGIVTPLALLSIVGLAVYAAPLLLPFLWIAARPARSLVRGYLILLAALVAGEVFWVLAWNLFGPAQLVAPLLAILAVAVAFHVTLRVRLSVRQTAVLLVVLSSVGALGAVSLVTSHGTAERSASFERSGS